MTIEEAFQLALQHHQAGRLVEAETLYRQILSGDAKHAGAWHYLGVIAQQAGRYEMAVQWIQHSLALRPQDAHAYSNLGEAYRALGRRDEAIEAYRRALELRPDHAQAWNNLANALREVGRFAESREACRRALELHPDDSTAWLNLGNARWDENDFEGAIAAARRALELTPDYAEAANNLGISLKACGRTEDAIAAYRRALELKPNFAAAHNNLGNALRERGCRKEAEQAFLRALEIDRSYAEALLNLAVVRGDEECFAEAAELCRRAIELRPELPEAHVNLGAAMAKQGRLDEAVTEYLRALALQSDHVQAHVCLGNAYKDQGRLDEAIGEYRRVIEIARDNVAAHSNLIYALHFQRDADAPTIAAQQARWNEQFRRSGRSHANDRNPRRRLRVGYVSADFRDHVIGRNLLPFFKQRDRGACEMTCYSGVIKADDVTREIQECADRWRSTLGIGDEALVEMIRADGVDILVDLSQHLEGNRLTVFAHRPAPVQVSFAGYPESAGLEAIPYRISDRFLESAKDGIFLLDSFWCYDPCRMDVRVNELPAGRNGWVTFGCLNNFCKVNAATLRLWAKVLTRVGKARLKLLSAAGSHRLYVLDILRGEGVEPERVEFFEPRSRQSYLELYHQLDVVLDTFPYNGHTTSLDALWMGVPVVSLAGQSAVSRAGLSQLTNLGLREWIAHSEDEYLAIAVGLAGDRSRLVELRATLRSRMETSVLMDAPRFARQIEGAFRSMWQQWIAGAGAP